MVMIRRTSMVFLSHPNSIISQRARMVLTEKGVNADIEYVDLEDPSEDFLQLNPYKTLPVLVDRDLVLNQSNVIMEYLDERFPHPPLLPVYPISRAKSRLMIHRIEQDWYTLLGDIENNRDPDKARELIISQLQSIVPAFKEMPYFLSSEFSLVDCCIAPVLWRLPAYGITLSDDMKPLQDYMDRIFERTGFQASLSEEELLIRDMYGYDDE
ncbi:MAG TPA: glutathione S-transferase N-terminal domain-containing protein [Gammaproteobacteria bacterium]|nr:glutathione S-transferase N-terminal domain-containing protein [Gammaproteobacteria bacterium]